MPDLAPKNSFGARSTFETGSGPAYFYRLAALQEAGLGDVDRMPFSIKVLLESLLRNENGYDVTADDVRRLAAYDPTGPGEFEVPFKPARVLLQDFTGVPAVVDLAALRSAMRRMRGACVRYGPLFSVPQRRQLIRIIMHGDGTGIINRLFRKLQRGDGHLSALCYF